MPREPDPRLSGRVGQVYDIAGNVVPRGGDRQNELLLKEGSAADAGWGGKSTDEGDVDAVVGQRTNGILSVELAQNHVDAGVLAAEPGEHCRERLEERGRDRADAQPPELAASGISGGRLGFVGHVHQPTALLEQHLAGRRERHRTRGAGEQLRSKPLLERLDGLRQGRLRHVQALCGSPEVQLLGDRDEVSGFADFQHSSASRKTGIWIRTFTLRVPCLLLES